MSTVPMAVLGQPCAVIKLLRPRLTMANTPPIRYTDIYRSAYTKLSLLAPNAISMPSFTRNMAADSTAPVTASAKSS